MEEADKTATSASDTTETALSIARRGQVIAIVSAVFSLLVSGAAATFTFIQAREATVANLNFAESTARNVYMDLPHGDGRNGTAYLPIRNRNLQAVRDVWLYVQELPSGKEGRLDVGSIPGCSTTEVPMRFELIVQALYFQDPNGKRWTRTIEGALSQTEDGHSTISGNFTTSEIKGCQ